MQSRASVSRSDAHTWRVSVRLYPDYVLSLFSRVLVGTDLPPQLQRRDRVLRLRATGIRIHPAYLRNAVSVRFVFAAGASLVDFIALSTQTARDASRMNNSCRCVYGNILADRPVSLVGESNAFYKTTVLIVACVSKEERWELDETCFCIVCSRQVLLHGDEWWPEASLPLEDGGDRQAGQGKWLCHYVLGSRRCTLKKERMCASCPASL